MAQLYTWNWGKPGTVGYNQTWAESEQQALEKAEEICSWLFPTLHNLRRVGQENSPAVDSFWKHYPSFD
jgi:hypothetical protein